MASHDQRANTHTHTHTHTAGFGPLVVQELICMCFVEEHCFGLWMNMIICSLNIHWPERLSSFRRSCSFIQ